ncbi:MAG: CoA-binding protein [Sulfolobales archaeon]|nr:CoA-binding protein [Sulfolobales archaeon]MDW8083417.1 CoA-binding protein [Sulfolobales archaeon]
MSKLKHSSLEFLFKPRSIVVVGASERPGSVGRAIVENLLKTFRGKVYPVNWKYEAVFGLKCYRSVVEVPETPDLAVIATPARSTPEIARELCSVGVKACIVVSAGFREVGTEGVKLESELVGSARSCGMRILGPNCLGIYDAWSGVDTIFNPGDRQSKPGPGSIALLSQSGALGAAILDWLAEIGIGMSKFVSYGNAADIKEWELIEYLAEDPQTRIVALYIEGVEDGRKFVSSLRKTLAVGKPVIVLKGGRTQSGVRAAASHTGALTASSEVFISAVRQAGAVVVNSLSELVGLLKVLEWLGTPRGRRVAIVTNGGGMGVLAADEVERGGMKLATLSAETLESLRKILPPAASSNNPIDILGDAPPERYRAVVDVVLSDGGVDLVLVITLMQSPAFDPLKFVELMRDVCNRAVKPIALIAPGGEYTVKYAKTMEKELKIPYFKSPEEAVGVLRLAVEWYERYVRGVYNKLDQS